MIGILLILCIFTIVFLIITYHNNKPTLCDSCKHLKKKGDTIWRYVCNPGNKCFDDKFDRAPTYCIYYCKRDDE